MCGRFNIISDPFTQLIMDIVNGELNILDAGFDLQTRYNIAPTENIPVLLKTADGEWDMRDMRWWLVPAWASEPSVKYSMFNAKSETLSKSRAFQGPFKRSRCIIPASGYYEWTNEGGVKLPHLIEPENGHGFAFAGLWDRWQRDGKIIESCTVITGAAPNSMAQLHKRIPIHLNSSEIATWLDVGATSATLLEVLSPRLRSPLLITPLSSYVGNSRHKDARCIEPLGDSWTIH